MLISPPSVSPAVINLIMIDPTTVITSPGDHRFPGTPLGRTA